MFEGQRVGVGIGIAGALLVVGAAMADGQGNPGQQGSSPAQKYPYPVVRDLKGVIPPGPRPLPSPPLGAGPWTVQTTEAKIRVSVVTKGFSHPYGFAFLPDGNTILISERAGAEKQRILLEEEGVIFVKDKVDMKKYGWKGPGEEDEPKQATLF